LLSFTLTGCSDYAMKSAPKIDLTKSEAAQLLNVTTLNFACGYYGRYSSNMDAPMIYEPYIETGLFGIELLKNSTINGEPRSQKQKDDIDKIDGKLAYAMRHDIDKRGDKFTISLILKGLAEAIRGKNSHNVPRPPSPVPSKGL